MEATQICNMCKHDLTMDKFSIKKGGGHAKGCKACLEKKRERERERKNRNESSRALQDSLPENEYTEQDKSKKKKNRNEMSKKASSELYRYTCPITHTRGPAVQLAHIIPVAENDGRYNIIPLRADLHCEFDANFPLWTFDPGDIRDSEKTGFNRLKMILSDKGDCDTSSCKQFENQYFDIRTESIPFIEEAYKRFIRSVYPEKSEKVGYPTNPFLDPYPNQK